MLHDFRAWLVGHKGEGAVLFIVCGKPTTPTNKGWVVVIGRLTGARASLFR